MFWEDTHTQQIKAVCRRWKLSQSDVLCSQGTGTRSHRWNSYSREGYWVSRGIRKLRGLGTDSLILSPHHQFLSSPRKLRTTWKFCPRKLLTQILTTEHVFQDHSLLPWPCFSNEKGKLLHLFTEISVRTLSQIRPEERTQEPTISPEYGLQWRAWAGFPSTRQCGMAVGHLHSPSGSHLLSGTEPISQGHCED